MDTDILGKQYESRTIELDADEEGPVVATLVRRRPAQQTGRAVLYLHGFTDYFFHAHLAEFFAERGWDFYALDLRKYGRSLLPHQTPNFCRDLRDYFPELDAAAQIIREENRNRTLLVIGHSTGGLLAALWAHARRDTGIVNGLFLNSPFFDFHTPWLVRRPLLAAAAALSHWSPYRSIPRGNSHVYGHSLHADYRGEWNYNLSWKPLGGFPVRLGWLAAICRAQRQLRAGLAIPVPVLVGAAARSFRAIAWHDAVTRSDVVLNVEHMARWAPSLGRHVTLIRFEDGLHDLTLSRPAVRRQVFTELDRWLSACVVPGVPTIDRSDGGDRMPDRSGAQTDGIEPAPQPATAPVPATRIPETPAVTVDTPVPALGTTVPVRTDSATGVPLDTAVRPDPTTVAPNGDQDQKPPVPPTTTPADPG